jgi:hypothetical protein
MYLCVWLALFNMTLVLNLSAAGSLAIAQHPPCVTERPSSQLFCLIYKVRAPPPITGTSSARAPRTPVE